MSASLCQLRISHGWYGDGRLPDLSITADAGTRALLHRFGIGLYAQPDGFALLANQNSDGPQVLAALASALGDAPLRLRLSIDPARLAAVTELPAGQCNLPDFSSRQCQHNNAPGCSAHRLRPLMDQTTQGQICLYPDDLAAAMPTALWQIQFDARSLPWAYYIVNRSQTALEQPFVRRADGLCLQGPQATRLPDGTSALCFDSGETFLPLQQTPQIRFSLFDRAHSPLSQQANAVWASQPGNSKANSSPRNRTTSADSGTLSRRRWPNSHKIWSP